MAWYLQDSLRGYIIISLGHTFLPGFLKMMLHCCFEFICCFKEIWCQFSGLFSMLPLFAWWPWGFFSLLFKFISLQLRVYCPGSFCYGTQWTLSMCIFRSSFIVLFFFLNCVKYLVFWPLFWFVFLRDSNFTYVWLPLLVFHVNYFFLWPLSQLLF